MRMIITFSLLILLHQLMTRDSYAALQGSTGRNVNLFLGDSVCQRSIQQNITNAMKNACAEKANEQYTSMVTKLETLEKEFSDIYLTLSTRPAAVIGEECSPGYVYYQQDNFCYKFHRECKSWPQAREVCQQEGGDLISLNADNYNFFINLTQSKAGKAGDCTNVWVGTTHSYSGRWNWLNGAAIGSFFWAPGQPDNWASKENCGDLSQLYGYKMNDEDCFSKSHFICQNVAV